MADTEFFDLDDDDWTEISTGGPTGYIKNNGPRVMKFIEAAIAPSANDKEGHQLDPKNSVRYTLFSTQKVFARSNSGRSTVAVTPD